MQWICRKDFDANDIVLQRHIQWCRMKRSLSNYGDLSSHQGRIPPPSLSLGRLPETGIGLRSTSVMGQLRTSGQRERMPFYPQTVQTGRRRPPHPVPGVAITGLNFIWRTIRHAPAMLALKTNNWHIIQLACGAAGYIDCAFQPPSGAMLGIFRGPEFSCRRCLHCQHRF